MTNCPCCSKKSFGECCEPILTGEHKAESPEALMRSRYTAHVKGNAPYLIQTCIPEQREELDVDELNSWIGESRWKALNVLESGSGNAASKEGWVEFDALFQKGRKHFRHHERSFFEQHDGIWYYDMHPDLNKWSEEPETVKLGRNDTCPCGSARKLKKCCSLL